MTPEEYNKQFKSKHSIPPEESGGETPKVTIINSTPEEQYQAEMQFLSEAGADYGGLGSLRKLLRRRL